MTHEEFIETWSPDCDGLVVNTSGSTGTPKRIVLSREMVVGSALRTNRFFGITEGSRLHVPLDFNYIAAKMMGVRAALSGAQLTSEVPSNRPMSDSNLFRPEETIDLLAVVPSQMEYILDNVAVLPKLKSIIVGGGMIPEKIKERIVDSGLNVWETYGMTETASHIALRRVGEEWFETLEGISVEKTKFGCLRIHIQGHPEIETNDIAVIKDERHFRIIGRVDNVINTGGKKVFAEELEAKLQKAWPELTFAITSAPDEKWGERIIAVVERPTSDPSNDTDIEELLSIARPYVFAHELPKEIRFVSSLPRTSNGKIDRKAL